eukprot:scaffold1522_cov340-Prasinococcus_capsulatus_cf.AAC.13
MRSTGATSRWIVGSSVKRSPFMPDQENSNQFETREPVKYMAYLVEAQACMMYCHGGCLTMVSPKKVCLKLPHASL